MKWDKKDIALFTGCSILLIVLMAISVRHDVWRIREENEENKAIKYNRKSYKILIERRNNAINELNDSLRIWKLNLRQRQQ
jgi:hypothetical protein